jgi:hypothetical protein
VGQGLSVDAGKLAKGSQDVAGLQERCDVIARGAVTALEGMAGSAGHAGLASALARAAGHGARTFEQMGAAYRHVSDSLAASAANYTATEQALAARTRTILQWWAP